MCHKCSQGSWVIMSTIHKRQRLKKISTIKSEPLPEPEKQTRQKTGSIGPVDVETVKLICDDIEEGCPVEVCFAAHGLSDKLERYMGHESVRRRVEQAEAKSVLKFWKIFSRGAAKDSSQAQSLLSIRWPSEFSVAPRSIRTEDTKKGRGK